MSNKVAIDEDAFLNIIDQMRITIPQEIKQAREVALERDKYIAQAHEEARRIIAQAREEAARQLDEHVLRQQAEERANAVLKKALEEATRFRAGADEYAEGKLRELARQLERLQEEVRNGLAIIEGRKAQQAAILQEAGAQSESASMHTTQEAAQPKGAQPGAQVASSADGGTPGGPSAPPADIAPRPTAGSRTSGGSSGRRGSAGAEGAD
ncbi:MAG: hypothetical protein H5T69_05010 [Chloroflexi bacterium]|nr:hypothetical protein [Chloroflexota bacterium]